MKKSRKIQYLHRAQSQQTVKLKVRGNFNPLYRQEVIEQCTEKKMVLQTKKIKGTEEGKSAAQR